MTSVETQLFIGWTSTIITENHKKLLKHYVIGQFSSPYYKVWTASLSGVLIPDQFNFQEVQ